MNTIKAIETTYNGYRFRSRLEARWAVFMDKLDIKYEYEKEGFDLDGTWYLPDFWLPKQKRWVEIKGQEATKEEKNKARLLALKTGFPTFILAGNIGMTTHIIKNSQHEYQHEEYKATYFSPATIEDRDNTGKYADWQECGRCHKVGLNLGIGFIRWGDLPWLFCQCHDECYGGMKKPDHELSLWHNPSKDNNIRTDKIIKAYQVARSARFEHGETP